MEGCPLFCESAVMSAAGLFAASFGIPISDFRISSAQKIVGLPDSLPCLEIKPFFAAGVVVSGAVVVDGAFVMSGGVVVEPGVIVVS